MRTNVTKLVPPRISVHHRLESGFHIEVQLAGADKESVQLEMGTYGFSVEAEGHGIHYQGICSLGYNISPEEARANYDGGVLYISLPIKERTLYGTRIAVT